MRTSIHFGEPLVLLALLVLPVLFLLYIAYEKRRGGRVARFANPALLPNLLPKRPGWRRHVIPVIVLLAMAALLVGAANPHRTTTVPRRQATIVLAIDTSGSMQATDVHPTRLAAAESAALRLVDELPKDAKVAVVGFTQRPVVATPPTNDRNVIASALHNLQLSGGTAIGDALTTSLSLVDPQGTRAAGPKPPAAIVLLSDGANTGGYVGPIVAAEKAKAAHVPVSTISLGTRGGTITDPKTHQVTPVTPEPAKLAAIAKAGGGKTYQASDITQLRDVYANIGKQIGTRRVPQDLTVLFVAGAAALVLLAAGASLRWFRSLA
jgi:Ca-activated chloride channel family protein